MNPFVFENPTRIVFGGGVISKLEKEIRKLGFKKSLIVLGKSSIKKNGFLKKVTDQLDKISIEYVIFEGVTPNPTTLQAEAGARAALAFSCDSIIALGGGSVMDCAKVIALIALQGGNAWDYTGGRLEKPAAVEKALPILTIPTLAATGSEADPIAVISNPGLKEKKSISGYALYPKTAVIDPELTLTCNLKTSLEGVMDILCHSSETYFSTKDNTPIQDGITETISRILIENARRLKENLFNIEARTQISWASTLAMAGFLTGRNGGWPMHMIEHQISGMHPEISHGAGLSALFIPMLEWDARHAGMSKLKQFMKQVFNLEPKTLETSVEQLIQIFKEFGLYTNLKKLGVKKEEIPEIAQGVLKMKGNKENKLVNVVDLTEKDIEQIIRRAYEI